MPESKARIYDRASDFSLEYLRILEERLDIRWNETDGPIFLPSKINRLSLERLRNEITELFNQKMFSDAQTDCAAFGRHNMQTVGFGLVQNFDKFVKLGFICGRRLILWDFLARILDEIDDSPDGKTLIENVACNLLRLRPIVERGGLVILPHPASWHERTKRNLSSIPERQFESLSTADFGLITALSALETMKMHPYTLANTSTAMWPKHPDKLKTHDFYSKEHASFHRGVENIFEDTHFAYLEGISAARFYEILSTKDEFYLAMRDLFDLRATGSSEPEIASRINQSKNKLVEMIEHRNRQIFSTAATDMSAVLGAMAAYGAYLNSQAVESSSLALGAAVLALSSALFATLPRFLNREKESVLIQTFVELKDAAREEAWERYNV